MLAGKVRSSAHFISEGIFDENDKFLPQIADSHRNSYFEILTKQKILPESTKFTPLLADLKLKVPQKLKHADSLRLLNEKETYYSKEILESLITYFENDITSGI